MNIDNYRFTIYIRMLFIDDNVYIPSSKFKKFPITFYEIATKSYEEFLRDNPCQQYLDSGL